MRPEPSPEDRAIAAAILNSATVITLEVWSAEPLEASVKVERPDGSHEVYRDLTDSGEIESIMECHAVEAQIEGWPAAVTSDGSTYAVLA